MREDRSWFKINKIKNFLSRARYIFSTDKDFPSPAKISLTVIQPRTDSPDHLRFIGITDADGHSEFVYTNSKLTVHL